jgi:hypothetical protein
MGDTFSGGSIMISAREPDILTEYLDGFSAASRNSVKE